MGFTTDHRGLIFSVRRGAKSGGYVVHVDEPLLLALEELRDLLAEEQAAEAEAASPSKQTESSLSVREVQARLRRGRTIDQVAREAGVDGAWVARFAVPILAEQAEIIRAARTTRMTKQRVGVSGAPLGDAVYRNLAERGVTDARDELDRAWRARQLTDGVWLVSITYSLRGVEREAVWEYDEMAVSLRSRNRLATQLGFREPARRLPTATTSTEARTKPSSATSTARTSTSRQATKRVATARRAAAARMVSDAEKATRRNAAVVRKAATKPLTLLPSPTVEPRPRRKIEPPAPPRAVEPRPRRKIEPQPPPRAVEPQPRRKIEPPPPPAPPPPPPSPPPPPAPPLLVDEPVETPRGWREELHLAWDEPVLDAADYEAAALLDYEPDDLDYEPEDEVEVEYEEEVEVEPVSARRREPLRARTVEPELVPTRFTDGSENSNGPVFRSDLRSAADLERFDVDEPVPVEPLVAPARPVERERRRRRPLRGR